MGGNRESRMVWAPISFGDLIDRITILRIKSERIGDAQKLAHVRTELEHLERIYVEAVEPCEQLASLEADLRAVNEALWDVENKIRACEARMDFGSKFIDLARSVYRNNDRRSELKRTTNLILGSQIVEEKDHQ